jgi:3-hydroxybutyrate dehydrogenase
MSLAGRHAFVTGGGRGIGRAIAAALTREGALVTVSGRTKDALDMVIAAGEAQAAIPLDVTDAEAVAAAALRLGPVDILVANAGAAESAPFLKTDDAMFRRMFEVNVMGVVHVVRAMLPGMLERRSGRIIVTASTASLKGYGYVAPYVAAKHAVLGLVRSLALETAGRGVTVNAVCPGYADTDMTSETLRIIAGKTGRSHDEALASLLAGNPLGRLVSPDEVAAACIYLAGDAAAAVTGVALPIAGGEA